MMPHCFIEMKMINQQRAEFKGTLRIKLKTLCGRLAHLAEMSLQQLKMLLSSLYGHHVFVCMTDNIGACS